MWREEINDEQWIRLEPLLPPLIGLGRPYLAHRPVISGIIWVLRTGAPWRDVPDRFGQWTTIASRFRRWTAKGIWQAIWTELQRQADQGGQLDWSMHFVDGTIVRAHQCAAGARGGQHDEALGRSRGGFGTKIHLRAEGQGKPMAFVLSGGERHEAKFLAPLLETGAVVRAGRGRPRLRPDRLVGDRGYSYPTIRKYLHRLGIRVTIPRRRNQGPDLCFDAAVYKERNRIERLVGRLKHFRRIATRYDKRAVSYQAWLIVAAILLWL
ncbi:IS5 family transposase (plasmid) [Deinococcus taeanensis]|uniref:IS5 family transposase n=1 Tax=Deinococcus taeanensis TaxID=2737050 RepID=UPI001CDC4D6E|nr:IS5 family transposase [Deinococcus taeanensis]UBV44822.1 IS5 family transposase [Deinococcus taeanensis]